MDMDTFGCSTYINRELSWLQFNYRVLEEAMDENNPLLERVNFMGIVSSNLDEFFMVRVGSLKEQVLANYKKLDHAGLTPIKQLERIYKCTHKLVEKQYEHLYNVLISLLELNNINFLHKDNLDLQQKNLIDKYFIETIFPVLTPLAVDIGRPFPLLKNRSLNIGVILRNKDNDLEDFSFAIVQVPKVLPRLIDLPSDLGIKNILIENIIMMNLDSLFQGHEIIAAAPFRITRNADINYDEEEAEDLLRQIEERIKLRDKSNTIRLEINNNADKRIYKYLQEVLELDEQEIFFINGALDLTFLFKFSKIKNYDYLRFATFDSVYPEEFRTNDIFKLIREGNRLVHHPYDSFQTVINFIEQASNDEKVLAIKQTLYRVSGDSPIIAALANAAEKGKQVTVIVEIKARFDEENNIQWARKLEEAGCHVIYGLVGIKIHCKLTLIVRQEKEGIRKYMHLGTGNYNEKTAKLYTDLGYFTCDKYLGYDISSVFNMISGYSKPDYWYKIAASPISLREKLIELIKQEIELAREGKKAHIIAKINSLVDHKIIKELYIASQAGVKIDLIVRGICCLVPGIKGISENIKVISIVGKYLEHSRVHYFYNDGNYQVYLSSADWMPRNLNRRIEVMFPIKDEQLKRRVKNILTISLKDNVKLRLLGANAKYKRIEKKDNKIIDSQLIFENIALKGKRKDDKDKSINFNPILNI